MKNIITKGANMRPV